jgi:hypothetical protein
LLCQLPAGAQGRYQGLVVKSATNWAGAGPAGAGGFGDDPNNLGRAAGAQAAPKGGRRAKQGKGEACGAAWRPCEGRDGRAGEGWQGVALLLGRCRPKAPGLTCMPRVREQLAAESAAATGRLRLRKPGRGPHGRGRGRGGGLQSWQCEVAVGKSAQC